MEPPFLPQDIIDPNVLPHPIPQSQRRHSLSPNALPAHTPLPRKELQSLNGKIKQEVACNRRRFERLLSLNPYFSMKLLSPTNILSSDEYHSGTLAKMLRQMDLLLEQGNLLEKQIKKTELRKMQVDHQDPTVRDELKHHFAFLRRVWVDFDREETKDTLNHMEQLNKRVVIIKNSILAVSDLEKKKHGRPQQDHYEAVDRRAREVVKESEEYRILREHWETVSMQLEEKDSKIHDIMQKYEQRLRERETEIGRLHRQSEQLRKNNKQLKEKVFACEKREGRLVEQISELQGEIKAKTKTALHLKENTEANSNLRFFKEDNYINQIKFRKIDFDPQPHLRRSHIDNKETPHSHNTIPQQIDTQQQKTSHSLPQITPIALESSPEPLRSQQEIIEQDGGQPQKEESPREDHMRENRSIDGRKGRFTRMRSPANGKLMKGREDERRKVLQGLSPRVREMREDYLAAKTCQLQ